MDLFDLAAKITLDTSSYESGLANAESKTSSFGGKLKTALGTAGKIGGAAIGAVAGATAALSTALIKGTSNLAAYGDNIDKMSQKMGLSAEAYQEWDAVMKHSGTSIETMQAGMKTLANAVENGNDAFKRLGMSQEEIAGMSQEELFDATITALQNVENETERTYLAGQLLGRGATELGALLNTSAEDTQAMKDRVHELGGVMSDEAVKSAAAFQDSLQDMQTAFSGLGRGIISDMMPAITTVMDGLTEIFSGNGDAGIEMISTGIDQLVTNITDKLPAFIDLASGIISALVDTLMENLPIIVDGILQLVDAIVQQLPDLIRILIPPIVQIAVQIIAMLIEYLPEILQALWDAIVAVLDSFGVIDWFKSVWEDIKGVFSDVKTWLNEKIIQPITEFFAEVWQKIKDFFDPLIEFVSPILEALRYLFETVWQAIQIVVVRVTDSLKEKITGVWSEIKDWINERILEPLKTIFSAAFNAIYDRVKEPLERVQNTVTNIFDAIKKKISDVVEKAKNWGRDLIDNFVSGIKDKVEKVGQAIKGVADKIKSLIGFSEPDEGPLSNFHTYAPDMMKLFAQGIRDNERLITDQISKSFDFGERTIAFGGKTGNWSGIREAEISDPVQPIQLILDGRVISETVLRYDRSRKRMAGV